MAHDESSGIDVRNPEAPAGGPPKSPRHKRLRAYLGESFPDPADLGKLKQMAEGKKRAEEERRVGQEWTTWVENEKKGQKTALDAMHMHWARHRLFRSGHQWIATRDGRKWKEADSDKGRIRQVFNMVGPALDFQLTLMEEQQPGWRAEPLAGGGTEGREVAEAQQSVTEYYYHTQDVWELLLEAASHAQTDGVHFGHVFINKEKGEPMPRLRRVRPEDPNYEGYAAQGYKKDGEDVLVPVGAGGDPLPPGSQPETFPAGEIDQELVPAQFTFADPEAATVNGPARPARWFVIQRPRSLHAARQETGNPKLEADSDAKGALSLVDDTLDVRRWQRGLPPYPENRVSNDHEAVWEYLVYFREAPDLPGGLWVKIMGGKVLGHGKTPGGVIPVFAVRDGSPDPQLYPRPRMSTWIGDQISINAMGSKILEYARAHSGARILALKDTPISESWSDIVGSIIEYQGPKPDVLRPPNVSRDLWQMWNTMIGQLEDKTGWNDLARGKLGGDSEAGFQDVSGRAALAARELFERQYGPPLRALSRGATAWAELVVIFAKHLYKGSPRMIPRASRPDLAKKITADALGARPTVYMDEQTLMPLPRALRNQMLFDHLESGLISVQEYRERAPYAEIRNLNMGGVSHWERAQWINTVLEERWEELQEEEEPLALWSSAHGLPILWQDDPSVHMRALEEISLNEQAPWGLRKLAATRWGIYADLQRTKSFPEELRMQGMQPPLAPAEVIGVPPSVAQAGEPSEGERVPGAVGDLAGPPGASGQPGAMAAPESAPVATPEGAQAAPAPLGTHGGMEAALSQ